MRTSLIDPLRATNSIYDTRHEEDEASAEQQASHLAASKNPMAAKHTGVYAVPTDVPKAERTSGRQARWNVGLLGLFCISFGWIAYNSFLVNQKHQETSAVLATQQSSISALHAALEAAQRNHTEELAQMQTLRHDKADVSALATGLAAKADLESVAVGGQAAKADYEALADAIAESRRNHTNVEAQLQAFKEAGASALATGLAAKADAVATEAAIAESRRNHTNVEAQMARMVDQCAAVPGAPCHSLPRRAASFH